MKRSRIAVIIGIFIGALALRIYGINRCDLWFDELISNYYSYENIKAFAELSGSSLINYFAKRVGYDPSSVLYYLVVYVYSFLFGAGQALRLLSAVFSMFALGIFYKLSRLFFDRKVCVFATLIMALSPMQIWYAQEARGYAMATFLVLLTVYFYVRALRTEKLFYLILFTLSCIGTCYASYFSVFLLLPMGIMFIWNRYRKNNTKWALAVFLILSSIVPLFFIFATHFNFVRSAFWLPIPSLRMALNTFTVFILGYSSAIWQVYTAPTIFIGLYAYGAYSYFRTNRRNAIVLFLLFLPPIAITYFISRYITPLYLDRQLLMYSPFYYLFIAKGTLSIKNRLFKGAVIVLVMAYMGISLINYYHGFMLSFPKNRKDFYIGMHAKKNYSGLMAFIDARLKDKDAILATDIQSYAIITSCFRDYIIQKKPVHIGYFFYPYAVECCLGTKAMVNSLGVSGLSLKTRQLYGWWFINGKRSLGKPRLKKNGLERIWLVSSSWHLNNSLRKNSSDIRNYMFSNYKHVLSMEKDGVYVDFFEIVPN